MIHKLVRILFKIPGTHRYFFGLYRDFLLKRNLLKGKVETISVDGIKFQLHLEDWIQSNIYFLGYYEKLEKDWMLDHLPVNGTFIDIGANIGYYSLYAARKVGKNGKVISIEPFPLNQKRFLINLDLNQVYNCQLIKKAIGEDIGTLELYYDVNSTNQGTISGFATQFSDKIVVEITSLDALVEQLQVTSVDVIKMDIEGFEFLALKGMKDVLQKYHPTIIMELSPEILQRASSSKSQIIEFLGEFGYQTVNCNNHNYLFCLVK